jgi:hypothetical protein
VTPPDTRLNPRNTLALVRTRLTRPDLSRDE